MIYFQCDYAEGAHPRILERLADTNEEQLPGYGADPYCRKAAERIRGACGAPEADVHFLIGGTQTNLTVIASALKAHQGVLAAEEGHIACHETGAVEATGHKVLTLPSKDGTLRGADVEAYMEDYLASETREHVVQPGMVYISHPTEGGALYGKDQLTELSQTCRHFGIPLFLDGARLGYALASPQSDVSLEDIAELCDVFYIGGTKCGALFGEAVVITAESLKKDFRSLMKQRGAMLAKGRLLGIQFDALFEDGLYVKICGHAVELALRIREAFEKRGIPMWGSSRTNQQFPILTEDQLQYFRENYVCEPWGKSEDGRSIVRFCTSWATKRENVEALLSDIEHMPETMLSV